MRFKRGFYKNVKNSQIILSLRDDEISVACSCKCVVRSKSIKTKQFCKMDYFDLISSKLAMTKFEREFSCEFHSKFAKNSRFKSCEFLRKFCKKNGVENSRKL